MYNMANKTRNLELIAEILVCANLRGNEAACKEHKIALRTLQSYRKLANEDPKLAHICALKKSEVASSLQSVDWAAELSTALRAGVRKTTEWLNNRSANMSTEEMKTTVGALKILGELKLQTEMLTDASNHESPVMEENSTAH